MNERTVSIEEYLETNQPTEDEKQRIRTFLKHLEELPESTRYCENFPTDRGI